MVRLDGFNFSFLMACRLITMFIIAATFLQFVSASAVDRHDIAARVPGSERDYNYLRGKMNFAAEESPQEASQHGLILQDRRLAEGMSFEADSVEVEDYTPPCANSKHDPSVCKHN